MRQRGFAWNLGLYFTSFAAVWLAMSIPASFLTRVWAAPPPPDLALQTAVDSPDPFSPPATTTLTVTFEAQPKWGLVAPASSTSNTAKPQFMLETRWVIGPAGSPVRTVVKTKIVGPVPGDPQSPVPMNDSLEWDGKNTAGQVQPPGTYDYSVLGKLYRVSPAGSGPQTNQLLATSGSLTGTTTIAVQSPVVTSPASPFYTNQQAVVLAGTGQAGTTIEVRDGPTLVGVTSVGGSGTWTVTTSALAEGTHTLSVIAVAGAAQSAPVNVTVIVDLTPPTIVIANPVNGQQSTALPLYQVTFDDTLSGINTTTFAATIDGTPFGGSFQVTATGATFQETTPLVSGSHTFIASIRDLAGNIRADQSLFTVVGAEAPPITPQSGFIDGLVVDTTSDQPLSGVEVTLLNNPGVVFTNNEGRYSFPTPGPGIWVITAQKPGFHYAQRRVVVEATRDVAAEKIRLLPRDTEQFVDKNVGATITDSTNSVQVVIPPGALPFSSTVSITNITDPENLPNPLPPRAGFGGFFFGEPSVAFSTPVTVRLRNTLGLAPGTQTAHGYWDRIAAQWVPDGLVTVTNDGQWLEGLWTHFSSGGWVAAQEGGGNPVEATDDDPGQPKTNDPKCPEVECSPQSVSYRFGVMKTGHGLPAIRRYGSPMSLSFVYDSCTAFTQSTVEVDVRNTFGAATNNRYRASVEGEEAVAYFQPSFQSYIGRFFFGGTNGRTLQLPSGAYRTRVYYDANYPSTLATTLSFGGPPVTPLGVASPNPLAVSRAFAGRILVHNRVESPFGAGWGLAGFERLFSNPDGSVMIGHGDGSQQLFTPVGTISTVGGTGTAGFSGDNGPASQAQFNSPADVAVDGSCTSLLVVDSNNDRIRRINLSSGVVTTAAGQGFGPYNGDGIPATDAFLALGQDPDVANGPPSMLCSADGSFVFSDTGHNRVRRVDASGTIFTIAGNGNSGFSGDGGLAIQAELREPAGLARNELGNIYIADRGNFRIRKVSPGGIITTILGNGTPGFSLNGTIATQASISAPRAIAIGPDRSLYFVDAEGSMIRRVDTLGIVRDVAGIAFEPGGVAEVIDGQSARATPVGGAVTDLVVDAEGNIFFTAGDRRVRKIDLDGIMTTVVGPGSGSLSLDPPPQSGEGGEALDASISARGVSVDAQGTLYIACTGTHEIRKIAAVGPDALRRFHRPHGDFSRLVRNANGTYTRTFKDQSRQTFDAEGFIQTAADRNGNTTTFVRSAGLLTSIQLPTGESYAFSYDGAGRLAAATDPAGRATTFLTNAAGDLAQITNPDGTSRQFTYDSRHLMTTQTDVGGAVTQYVYDGYGKILRVISAHTDTLTNQPSMDEYNHEITQALVNDLPAGTGTRENPAVPVLVSAQEGVFTDPRGFQSRHRTDGDGHFRESTDPFGRVTNVERDEDDLVTTVNTWWGYSRTNEYDSSGNLTRIFAPNNNQGPVSTFLEYDSQFNRLTRITDPLGRMTQFGLDAAGNVTSITDALNNATVIAYDSEGKPTSITDALGKTTTTEYQAGTRNVRRVTDPLNRSTQFFHDAAGNLTSVIDADGRTTSFQYDPLGRMTRATDPLGNATNYVYTPAGELDRVIDARGNVTRFEYTTAHVLRRAIDAQGNTTTYDYDADMQLVRVTDAVGGITSFTYDALGQQTSAADELGRTTTFDYDVVPDFQQWTHRRTTPLGQVTLVRYDVAGNLERVTDPLSQITSYSYNTVRELLSVTDPKSQTTTFQYDALSRMTRRTNPLGQSRNYVYDAIGRLASTLDANGQTIAFAYNVADELISKTWPTGEVTGYQYDALSRLTQVTDADSRVMLQYDGAGRVTGTQTGLAGSNQPASDLRYTYDAVGNRTSLDGTNDPNAPVVGVTNYAWDTLNRIQSITNPFAQTFSFGYDALSRRTALTRPNGVNSSYAYDAASQLLDMRHVNGATVLSSFSYTYDAAGRRTSMTDLVTHADATSDGGLHEYGYDFLDRLTSASHPASEQTFNPNEIFNYDPAGNRTQDNQVSGYTYDTANRLQSDSEFTYTFDANGNQTIKTSLASGQTTTYTYNPEDQLIRIDFAADGSGGQPGGFAEYFYDALGRRWGKRVVDAASVEVWTRYSYDGLDIVLEFDGTGTVQARWTHGPGIDEPLAMRQPAGGAPEDFFFHADALGSVVELTDSSGAVARSYRYNSFGRIVKETGTLANPFTYTGREFDAESGLYYHRARYYDSSLGRFLQEDPMAALNLFTYVDSSPLGSTDPSGQRVGSYGVDPENPRNEWHPLPPGTRIRWIRVWFCTRPISGILGDLGQTHCFLYVEPIGGWQSPCTVTGYAGGGDASMGGDQPLIVEMNWCPDIGIVGTDAISDAWEVARPEGCSQAEWTDRILASIRNQIAWSGKRRYDIHGEDPGCERLVGNCRCVARWILTDAGVYNLNADPGGFNWGWDEVDWRSSKQADPKAWVRYWKPGRAPVGNKPVAQ